MGEWKQRHDGGVGQRPTSASSHNAERCHPGGRVAAAVLVLASLVCGPALAQDTIDHGRTGTLNHDYFDAVRNPGTHLHWLVNDAEKNHLTPAIEDIRFGRYEKAWRDLDFLMQRFINHPKGLAAMVTVAILMQRPLSVIPYFEKAIRIYPQYAVTHAQYGLYLGRIGRYDAAVRALKRAIEMEPNLAVAHAWLAGIYARLGQAELARESGERARELGYKGKI